MELHPVDALGLHELQRHLHPDPESLHYHDQEQEERHIQSVSDGKLLNSPDPDSDLRIHDPDAHDADHHHQDHGSDRFLLDHERETTDGGPFEQQTKIDGDLAEVSVW